MARRHDRYEGANVACPMLEGGRWEVVKERRSIRNRRYGPSGLELASRRRRAGLTQKQLAKRAGVSRFTVSYWEALPGLDPDGWAVRRMAEALGWEMASYRYKIRIFADRDTPDCFAIIDNTAALQAVVSAGRAKSAARAAHRRVRCRAKTRKGTPCANWSEPGRRRCKFHGGKSTGAKTPKGRERLRDANRRRWAKWRKERAGAPQGDLSVERSGGYGQPE